MKPLPHRAIEAAVFLAVGYGVTTAVGLALGVVVMATQAVFDQPAYDWLASTKTEGSTYTALIERLTVFGDPLPSILQAAALTIVLALAYGRRWYIPALVLPAGIILELVLQAFIGNVVDREPPPLVRGTFFSGGSARIALIYGLSLFLIVTRWPSISRRWRIAGVLVVALLAVGMGYTRLYLALHWPTDVPAGWLMGVLISISVIGASRRLFGQRPLMRSS